MNDDTNTKFDPKAKYMLHYATDITKPPGVAPSEMVQFRWFIGVMTYVLRNKKAQDAIRANRFRFFTIDRKKKSETPRV